MVCNLWCTEVYDVETFNGKMSSIMNTFGEKLKAQRFPYR